jgi:hypothetical protein
MDDRGSVVGASRLPLAAAWPLVAVAVLVLAVTTRSAIQRMALPCPLTPWESILLVDGWRLLHGQAVYHPRDDGPATHMYGPLATASAALGVAVGGVDVRSVRAVSLLASVALVGVLAFALARRAGGAWMLFAAAVVAAQLLRTRTLFVEARPDAIAILVATLSALAMHAAMTRPSRSLALALAGAALAAGAMLFKQPLAAVAVVPILFVLMSEAHRRSRRAWMVASLPLVAVLLTLGVLRWGFPVVTSYVLDVPRDYPLQRDLLLPALAEPITWSSLAVLAVGVALATARPLTSGQRFALAAAIVFVPVAAVARSKVGGAINSYAPALLALAAFAILTLPALLGSIARQRGSLAATLAASLVATLLIVDVLASPRVMHFASRRVAHGDASYPRVIELVRSLPGRVAVADDPSILLAARGVASRSLHAEADANAFFRDGKLPQGLIDEYLGADWVVRVHARHDWVFDDKSYETMGLRRVDEPSLEGSSYSLWRRVEAGGVPTPRPPP